MKTNNPFEEKNLVKRYDKLGKKLKTYDTNSVKNNPNSFEFEFILIHNSIRSLSEILDYYYNQFDNFIMELITKD